MKIKLIILVVAVFILGVGAGYYYKNYSTVDWETYRNDEYGFEMKYPSPALPRPIDKDSITIRTFVEGIDECPWGAHCPYSLEPGEYMIWIDQRDCHDWFFNRIERKLDDGVIYTGDVDQGGDNPGVRHTLCAEKNNEYIKVTVTVNEADNLLAEQILETFTFLK